MPRYARLVSSLDGASGLVGCPSGKALLPTDAKTREEVPTPGTGRARHPDRSGLATVEGTAHPNPKLACEQRSQNAERSIGPLIYLIARNLDLEPACSVRKDIEGVRGDENLDGKLVWGDKTR